jgi:hypothetical protein
MMTKVELTEIAARLNAAKEYLNCLGMRNAAGRTGSELAEMKVQYDIAAMEYNSVNIAYINAYRAWLGGSI